MSVPTTLPPPSKNGHAKMDLVAMREQATGTAVEPAANEIVKRTLERMKRSNEARKKRGQFGGLTLAPLGNVSGADGVRFYQMNHAWGGIDHGCHLIGGDSNMGKCQKTGTPILMYDGTIKKIEDIRVGDMVMGPDSKPRSVLGTTKGVGEMHEVTQGKGNGSYIVNSEHVLSVKRTKRCPKKDGTYQGWEMSEPFNLPVKEYYRQSDTFRSRVMGYKVAIDFPYQDVALDPYFLGVWLGDGTASTSAVTSADPEIAACVQTIAGRHELFMRQVSKPSNLASTYHVTTQSKQGGTKRNPVINLLRQYNLLNNKHIPAVFRINSRSIRLSVLAGLIDTDGYFNTAAGTYEITQKSEQLANDILFLARSLGFHAVARACKKTCTNNGAEGIYQRIYISGDFSDVPIRIKYKQFKGTKAARHSKDKLNHHITVQPIGVGEYYGFELDGDGLYLMGDFTVTHNSSVARMIAYDLIRFNKNIHVRFYTLDDAEDYFFDCVTGDTRVHTRAGLIPARELAGRTVEVLSEGGIYRPAEWTARGLRQVCEIHLANGDTLYATENHEWPVTNGQGGTSKVRTKHLVGRRLVIEKITQLLVDDPTEFRAGVQHGLVYGDGSVRQTVEVLEVIKTDRIEEVYCCIEPETHTFVVENMYLTGNCFVAQAAKVPINAVNKPEGFVNRPEEYYKKRDYERMVERGHEMYQRFLSGEFAEKFSYVGTASMQTTDWTIIEDDIKRTRQMLPREVELVVFIDNFHDIEMLGFENDNNRKTEEVALRCGQLCEKLQITMIGTVELKKNNQRRPTLDDIFGSRKWKYKARTVILVYSEVGAQKPNPRLYYERPDKPNEQSSVLEVHFIKSKGNEFKGRLFYEQLTEMGLLVEVPKDRAAQYALSIS